MIYRLIALTLLALTLAQIPGCHFYVEGTPRFIVSSEPIHLEQPRTN